MTNNNIHLGEEFFQYLQEFQDSQLSQHYTDVFSDFYGLTEYTQAYLGWKYDITSSAINQRLSKSLRRIKHPRNAKRLRDYLENLVNTKEDGVEERILHIIYNDQYLVKINKNITNLISYLLGIQMKVTKGKIAKLPPIIIIPKERLIIDMAIKNKQNEYDDNNNFNPSNIEDAREKIVSSIVRRRGQSKFRQELMDLYNGKCAVTKTELDDVLDAAHIIPYKGDETNHPSNGLLLRSDIHVLFDLGFIGVNTEDMTVLISEKLQETVYKTLSGEYLHHPKHIANHPNKKALDMHREKFGL